MAKKEQDKAYWEERTKAEQAYMAQATDMSALNEHYERAIDDIQQKIDHEYARLEKLGFNKNVVEDVDIKAYEREAKQLVKEADNIRASLGRNAKRSDFTQAVNDRMTIYNATMRINRLEYLKSETSLSLTKAGVNTVGDMQKELTKKYVNEQKRQAGILGETIRHTSADKVMKQAMAQTNGATFSDRVWKNTDELKAQLDVLLTNNQIQGQNPKAIAQRLRSLVNGQFADKAKYVTERIARTESTRMIGAAQLDSYRQVGIEYTKWIAEASACDFCEDIAHGGKDGEGIYKLDKVPIYPRHPNCRCSLAGYYNPDEDKKTDKAEQEDEIHEPEMEAEAEIKKPAKTVLQMDEKQTKENYNFKEWFAGLSDLSKEMMTSYYHGTAYDINEDLRKGSLEEVYDYWGKENIQALDEATTSGHLNVNTQLHRKLEYVKDGDKIFDVKKGDVITDKGYTSTATNTKDDRFDKMGYYYEYDFNGESNVHIILDAPAGTKGASIQLFQDAKGTKVDFGHPEYEYLLPRNTSYEVESAEWEYDEWGERRIFVIHGKIT